MLDLRTVVSILSKIFSAFPPTPSNPRSIGSAKVRAFIKSSKTFCYFLKLYFSEKATNILKNCYFFRADGKDTTSIFITKFFFTYFETFVPTFLTHLLLLTAL